MANTPSPGAPFLPKPAPKPGPPPKPTPQPLPPTKNFSKKDDSKDAKARIVENKKEKEMTKRMVWCAVLSAMNELQELRGLPV
ncbi:hypothetical protein CGLO_17783 [Colletotrichum gloeosporioides Cg-14]|uniref:Uncharacterized protein n=1 Tax=Colletotrichum gloeosporioides (strain Cg-14) TaxID=1237896 RepID=T0KW60_COLGC|nr:hypothetical protein CGLO_17783 [Colletotrichum gloeosporioides Cg-14]